MTTNDGSEPNGHAGRFRADRALTLCGGYPISKLFRNNRRTRLPILMYHGIRDRLDGRHPYYETSTSPAVLRRHIKFLREAGYAAVSLDEALKRISSGELCGKNVALTFDDGYRDFYTDALPVLTEFGFKATLFLTTGRIGNERVRIDGNEYLTWSEVGELRSLGVTIGSHTVTHPELKNLDELGIERELGESKRTIEDELGASVKSFAYPYAFPETDRAFVKRLEAMLEKHGYENGVSTIIGCASGRHSRFFLPRLPVNTWDDERFLKAKLEGGYDWLHLPQLIYKTLGRAGMGADGKKTALQQITL